MISLDQVLLLEEKVESAVEKIKQLEAENDALRNKCSELTNALSAKTEQLAAVESDQNKIESGIIKAIDRLNSIENSVLKAAGQPEPKEKEAQAKAAGLAAAAAKVAATETVEEVAEEAAVEEVPVEEAVEDDIPSPATNVSFDQMMNVEPEEAPFEEEAIEDAADAIDQAFDEVEDGDSEPESKDQLGFDIF
ncbi:MAG: cell division protein ZapB [Treponema sp.]|nr:cell division protein ZapB [Treponema sp.]